MLENYFKQDWNEAIKLMDISKDLLNGIMGEYYKILKERINIFKKKTSSQRLGWCLCSNLKIVIYYE